MAQASVVRAENWEKLGNFARTFTGVTEDLTRGIDLCF